MNTAEQQPHAHAAAMFHEQEASQPSSSLGKRPLALVGGHSAGVWYPNAGVPCYSFGPEDSKRRCSNLHRTSLLFKELESRVHSAVQAKRTQDTAERAESARIAAANPLVFAKAVAAPARERVLVEVKPAMPGKAGVRKMPAPLSEGLLLQAMPELSTGASFAIKSCVDCWRDNRLADSDLISTVRSFSGSSPALSKAFSAVEECEVASLEDMRALAELSRMASAPGTPKLFRPTIQA
mmetsp:Transcript_8149/g.20234  ORF Transcript_8149/g.20234 Transcript_8149/m.20234 type:complete len:238 (+) Transcript_8149:76-789(+)